MVILTAFVLIFSSCIVKAPADKDSKLKTSENDFSFKQSYLISQPASLKISTSGGNISTIGYEGNQVEIRFIVIKYGRVLDMTLEDLKRMADVQIVADNSNLEINIRRITERNISVGFEIKTPFKTAAFLNTSGGNISIANLTANQNVNTSGGNINIKSIRGDVGANTSGGNVSVENSTGNIHATTSGGNISLNKLKGNIKTSTSGGNIVLSDSQGSIDVSTSGGSISLEEISGSVKAFTSGGNISAKVNQLTENLILETSGGNIDCIVPKGLGLDLNLSADNIDTPLSNFTGNAKKDRIQGKMNGGGIPVNLRTSGGSMILNYK